MDFLNKMKKQNGFSQIVIMVVMLILAIALPITANLVKKVQDNRSSAIGSEPTSACNSTTDPTDKTCGTGDGSNYIYQCKQDKDFKYFWKIVDSCSAANTKCNYGQCITLITPDLVPTSTLNSTMRVCSTDTCPSTISFCNRSGFCTTKFDGGHSCEGNYECKSGKCDIGGTHKCISSLVVISNGEIWQTSTVYPSGGSNCNTRGGFCGDYTSTPTAGESCMVGGKISNGIIVNGLCSGDTTVKCCVASTATPVSEPGTGGTSAADCSDKGSYCLGEAYKAGCLGDKVAVRNNCADKADHCAGEYYATAEAQNNKDSDGHICGDSRGCLGTKDCTPVAPTGCGAAAGTMHWLTGTGTAPTTTNLTTQNPLCTDGSKPTVNTNADYTYTWTCGSSTKCTAYWLNCNDLNYWAMYPDVKKAELRPWHHYQYYGQPEGRTWPTSGSTPFCWEGTKKITCGDVETGPNDTCGTNPVAPVVCVDDNSCANNTLVGQTCTNNCGKAVSGVKPIPVNGALGPANGTIVTTKPASAGACSAGSLGWTDDTATDGTYNWTCAGISGGTSVNGSATKADCTVGIQKCTTGNKYYTCADGLWANSTTLTACSGSKVCTTGNISATVCNDPAYVAPKLSMMFTVNGLKENPGCFGNLNFKVSVSKDGSNLSYIGDAVATVVAGKFSVKTEDQVLKISNFALPQTFALTDKIKIGISSDRKTLTTIYGKDGQNSGYPALDTSSIIVSSLDGKVLNLYEFPVLNGDIGSAEKIGVKDNMVNSADWVHMKNQWNNKCEAGKNIESDLNGDCLINSADLQILKNAMENQYSQKTF